MINVSLCDDHGLIRRGLRSMLEECADIRVVGEASNYAEARQILSHQVCDIMLLDLNLPGRNGLELLGELQQTHHPVKVIVLSLHPIQDYAVRCLKMGAYSYLNKAADPAEIVLAVRTVAQGRAYMGAEVAELLRLNMSQHDTQSPHDSLSSRELEVLLHIAQGASVQEIAQKLLLSPKTVSVYRHRVLEKLHVLNNVGLTTYAIQRQLI